ncbi:MAG TPA: ACP S-malonyltransferase [Balneolaceae bacterium]|nr:ACP S-malonyltransferase [Balneolaceae bacterium]
MKKAFIFPGQGSQFVGMAKDLYESDDKITSRFKEADDILGYSLTDIMFNGPEEVLKQTVHTQPAIFLHSVALFESMDEQPDMTAGHSLGEFSALVASGALEFKEAIELVALRGKLMQRAGSENEGSMAAIIGMEDEAVDQVCKDAESLVQKPVVPANYNCPGQLVISGDKEAVEKAVEMAKEKGCRLAKMLPVSGAFHSPLMRPALEGLRSKLEQVQIDKADIPVYSNYTALPTSEPDKIRENLENQLMNPVQWTKTMQNMYADGARAFIEIGPGKVLQGLVKRTLKNVEINGYQ